MRPTGRGRTASQPGRAASAAVGGSSSGPANVAGRDSRVVEDWFRDYAQLVLEYLTDRTDFQSAEDVLQEVFILAFRKYSEVPVPPIGWLLRTASKVLSNRRRGGRRRDDLVRRIAEGARETTTLGDTELKLGFAAAMSALSIHDQETLTLSGWYGLTPTQAAEALGCSPRTYAVRLHRARVRLSEELVSAGVPGSTPAARLAAMLHD